MILLDINISHHYYYYYVDNLKIYIYKINVIFLKRFIKFRLVERSSI